MYRRWYIKWDNFDNVLSSLTTLGVICGVWIALGIAAMFAAAIISQLVTGSGRVTFGFTLVMVVGGVAPIVLFFLGAPILIVRWLIREGIRRVSKSSPDLREIYRHTK